MKQILAMLSAAVLFVAAVAADAAELRERVVLDGEEVTLGDLFEGLAPERAGIPIARAPALGREVTLEAPWVARVARAYRVAYRPASPYERITIVRASHRVDPVAMESALVAELRRYLGEGRMELAYDGQTAELHLPTAVEPTVTVAEFAYEPVTGRFSATLAAPADGPAAARVAVSGRATIMVEVPVLAARLRSGHVIGAEDVSMVEMDGSRIDDSMALSGDELIGMSPRRTLSPGAPVRLDDLQPPTVIARSERVTMRVRHGALTVNARGRALEDGAVGDVIRVTNVDSRRTVEATVAGPGLVTVQPAASLALVN
jgi:flagella basal body P-ring formation protein FlgA